MPGSLPPGRRALVALKRVVDYGSVVRLGQTLVRFMFYMRVWVGGGCNE